MPCYETNLISVELKTADKDLLLKALAALSLAHSENSQGINIQTPVGSIVLNNGVARYTNGACQGWVNKIKQAYSLQTVQKVAQKYKFTLTQKPNNQIVLRRY